MTTTSSPEFEGAGCAPTPATCDVLVVGAGPAGSAAARWLAARGASVVLADAQQFPRDKVCGDGLISDALGALETLGLRERVVRRAITAERLSLYAPGGRAVELRGDDGCLPREELDSLLREAAREAGATMLVEATAREAIQARGRVAGVRFARRGGPVEVRAEVTLLATGASAAALHAFGFDVDAQPDAVAGRAYFQAPPEIATRFQELMIVYQRDWCPGYGWIFPSPGGRFNVGVGLFAGSAGGGRLHQFWRDFQATFPPAAAIVGASRPLGPFRGAPLRTSLSGDAFGRPGLMLAGEAASTTYSATGEGIGKAMESGLMAAELAFEALAGRRVQERLHEELRDAFHGRFRRRYRAYDVAQSWASSPFVLNVLAARASAGRFVREELEGLISERSDARRLFSAWGLMQALVR
jgi:geranylgeranyl reductase family protein